MYHSNVAPTNVPAAANTQKKIHWIKQAEAEQQISGWFPGQDTCVRALSSLGLRHPSCRPLIRPSSMSYSALCQE